MGWEAGVRNLVFYADNGRRAGQGSRVVARRPEHNGRNFRRIGLDTNLDKTKAMVCDRLKASLRNKSSELLD